MQTSVRTQHERRHVIVRAWAPLSNNGATSMIAKQNIQPFDYLIPPFGGRKKGGKRKKKKKGEENIYIYIYIYIYI